MTLRCSPAERPYCREPKPGHAALWLLVALVALGLALRANAEPAASPEPSSAATAKPVFGLEQVGWRWVRFEASNFWVSVEARIQLYQQALKPADRNWLQEPEPLTLPWSAQNTTGRQALVLMSESRVASNREWRSEWLNPHTGSLLQRCRLGYGRDDSRIKCYGYGQNAIYRERRESDMSGDDLSSPEGWSAQGARSASRLTQDWRATPPAHIILPEPLPEDAALISWPLLLPAISAQPLNQPGDRVQLWVHTDFDIWRVTLEVADTEEIKVDYELAPNARRVKGKQEALEVTISSEHLTGKPEDDFEFFGFSEPMSVLLDPKSRLPLVIQGEAPTFGPAKARLHSARLLP